MWTWKCENAEGYYRGQSADVARRQFIQLLLYTVGQNKASNKGLRSSLLGNPHYKNRFEWMAPTVRRAKVKLYHLFVHPFKLISRVGRYREDCEVGFLETTLELPKEYKWYQWNYIAAIQLRYLGSIQITSLIQ